MIGAIYIDAAGDLCWGQAASEGYFVSNFDGNSSCIIYGKGTGADMTFVTGWTPKFGYMWYSSDTTPASAETMSHFTATKGELDNWGSWAAGLVGIHAGAGGHVYGTLATAGAFNAMTAQSAGTAGSFTLDLPANDRFFSAFVSTDIAL